MSEPVKERDVNFVNAARTRVNAKGFVGNIRYIEGGNYPGVNFTTWEFEDIDGSLKDGALV